MEPDPGNTEELDAWGTAFRELKSGVFVATSLIGVVSGVAGLVTSGWGTAALRVIAALSVVFVVARLVNALLIVDRRKLRKKIKETQDQFADYKVLAEADRNRMLAAVERLVDRQGVLYTEALKIEVKVGADSAGDMVVQHHTTTPSPFLFYRSLRPIIPVDLPAPTTFDDLDLKVEVVQGDGVRPTILPLIANNRRVRILVIFEPHVDQPIEWKLSYRPRGLWDTLRRESVDQLVWDARTPSGGQGSTTLTEFTVCFEFPPGFNCGVAERGRRGLRENGVAGANKITWRDPAPAEVSYVWEVTMNAPEAGAGSS